MSDPDIRLHQPELLVRMYNPCMSFFHALAAGAGGGASDGVVVMAAVVVVTAEE